MPDLTDTLRAHWWNKVQTGFAAGQRDLSAGCSITLEALAKHRHVRRFTPLQSPESASHIGQQHNRRQHMQAFARQFRHAGKYHSACPIQLRLV